MRPSLSSVAVVILLASVVACSSSEDMALLHREITDVQRSVERLQTEAKRRRRHGIDRSVSP